MEIRWRRPDPRLAPFVAGHYVSTWEVPTERERSSNVLFPPNVTLVSDLERMTVRGVRRTTLSFQGPHRPRGMVLGTSFRTGAFGIFSEKSAASVNDLYAPPDALLGSAGEVLGAELLDLGDDEDAYFDAVESILLDRAPAIDAQYQLVRSAEQGMLASPPGVSIEEIAAQQAVSVRTLQRTFHQYVGVSPKWVLRRMRMWEAVDRIAEGRYESFVSLAHELAYSDQSHFARDFRDQTGFWPRRFERIIGSAAEEYDPSEPQGSRQLRRLLAARQDAVS